MSSYNPILLIESNNEDAKTIEIALNDVRITNKLERKVNIDEANEYLTDEYNPKPCIILLDINSLRMDAFEFLETLNTDYFLKQIPVIVLISSEEDEDAARNYKIDVAGYILKPFDYKQFTEAIRALNIHWALSGKED